MHEKIWKVCINKSMFSIFMDNFAGYRILGSELLGHGYCFICFLPALLLLRPVICIGISFLINTSFMSW